jgi:hypothetical protein
VDSRRNWRLKGIAPQRVIAKGFGCFRRAKPSLGDTATLVSQLRKRGLFAPATGNGFAVASAESLATLQRGPIFIFDGRGGIFFATLVRPAPLDPAVFTTVPAEHPRIDRKALAQKTAWLNKLKEEPLKIALSNIAKESGGDPADIEEHLSKSAQRYLRNESARERYRPEVRRLMEQDPKRPPKPLPELFEEFSNGGLKRQAFRDLLRQEAANLRREKGIEISWSAPGTPLRR